MTRLIITVGPQGAGKTTLCQSLMADADPQRVALFCRDSFLEELLGKDAWNPYLGLYIPGMERFYKTIAKEIGIKKVILIDSFFPTTHTLEEMQKRLGESVGEGYRLNIEAIWFTTPGPVTASQQTQKDIFQVITCTIFSTTTRWRSLGNFGKRLSH